MTVLDIINLMKDNPRQGYTIREISKKLKIPYSNINRAANSLIKEEVLTTQNIGKAKYCSLNLNSDSTINLLCQISIKDKKKFLKTNSVPLEKIFDIKDMISVVLIKSRTKLRIFIIVNKKDKTQPKIECSILEADEFITLIKNKEELKEELLHNSIILRGYENYWNLIKEAI